MSDAEGSSTTLPPTSPIECDGINRRATSSVDDRLSVDSSTAAGMRGKWPSRSWTRVSAFRSRRIYFRFHQKQVLVDTRWKETTGAEGEWVRSRTSRSYLVLSVLRLPSVASPACVVCHSIEGCRKLSPRPTDAWSFVPFVSRVCLCVYCQPIYSGRLAYGRTSRGHTGFLHLPSAVLALTFLARRIQPFLSLVDREVEFCVKSF